MTISGKITNIPKDWQREALHSSLVIRDFEDKGDGIVTSKKIEPYELVIVGRPLQYTSERTWTSFQINLNTHVELNEPARTLNHTCGGDGLLLPTVNEFGGYNFFAPAGIENDTELGWPYWVAEMTHELAGFQENANPCLCSWTRCFGMVVGWDGLSEEMQKYYLSLYKNLKDKLESDIQAPHLIEEALKH
jgi:uncharacterized protein